MQLSRNQRAPLHLSDAKLFPHSLTPARFRSTSAGASAARRAACPSSPLVRISSSTPSTTSSQPSRTCYASATSTLIPTSGAPNSPSRSMRLNAVWTVPRPRIIPKGGRVRPPGTAGAGRGGLAGREGAQPEQERPPEAQSALPDHLPDTICTPSRRPQATQWPSRAPLASSA